MNRHSQKGSALLIVLGFLSFMVVSAVAFAIWMRTERLPSSALRRSVANRYLVKAALAQAMSRVDDAIRSHPFPGAWSTNDTKNGTVKGVGDVYRDKNDCAYDWWESRVFMPPDPEGIGTISGKEESRYAPITKTVSVLNLEAFGYLPPALVNDVRMLSRSSWAAQWEYFNFDAGRYAFCAVNVSDMLDINKIAADRPRTSAAAARRYDSSVQNKVDSQQKPPPSRFSLAYLFRRGDSGNGFANPSDHDEFDKFTHTRLSDWQAAPLVSLLDYNLAMGNDRAGILYSPFYWFLDGRTTSGGFYGGGSGTPGVTSAARQPFVTDSWFPRSAYEVMQLKIGAEIPSMRDIAQYQPFLPGVRTSLREVESGLTTEFMNMMRDDGHVFSRQDPLMLYDYLDEDNVPLSLAMPCAERVPMVTALGPVRADLEVKFEESGDPEVKDVSETERWKIYSVKIKVTTPQFSSGLVFPFMSGSGDDNRSYDVQAFMRLVFVDEGADADPDTPAVMLRSNGFADLRPKKRTDWKDAGDRQFRFPVDEGDPNSLVVTSFGTDSWKPNVLEPQDVYRTDGWKRLGASEQKEETILKRIEVYDVKKSESGEEIETRKEGDEGERYQVVLRPFKSDGTGLVGEGVIPAGDMPKARFTAVCQTCKMRPYLMVWVRVKDGDDKTVDLVPAVFADDNQLNDFDNDGVRGATIDPFGNPDEKGMPILHFPSKMTFTYADVKNQTAPADPTWKYRSCYTVDPRFNWAPENWWYAKDEPSLPKWYQAVFRDDGILNVLARDVDQFPVSADNPRADRARDPILFVSNLGYLQSVGEMAFLPRLSEMDNSSQPSCALNEAAYDGVPRDRDKDPNCAKTMPCARVAWKSYQNYRTNADPNAFEFGANLYRRGLVNPQQGFYVNPFTQSKEVMLAAFANTPRNYWVAGTNYTVRGKSAIQKYSTTANGQPQTFEADTPNDYRPDYLAEYMMHRYEDLANMLQINSGNMTRERSFIIQRVWADMFDALDWGGRMEPGKIAEEVYEDLNRYYSQKGGVSGYKDMYTRANSYGALNYFQNRESVPGIVLDVSRASHLNELADPLYYYSGYPLNESIPGKEQNLRNPNSDKYICDADRMFLHSYWRDCFANRQQLFLIFVRAESTALGGNGEGTPAQQGGRAVALVWRDPEAPTGQDVFDVEKQGYNEQDAQRHPHKMRILFYRQLD